MRNETGLAHVAESDRVRANTYRDVNLRIDRQAEQRVRQAATEGNVAEMLTKLEREWDFERIVETEAAATALLGLALGTTLNRKFLIIPAVATSMMLIHALHGWYPLLPLLRRMGVRSQDEIERERYAIKALRGDFSGVTRTESDRRAEAAWRAVRA